jgi:hypothetical protein
MHAVPAENSTAKTNTWSRHRLNDAPQACLGALPLCSVRCTQGSIAPITTHRQRSGFGAGKGAA